MTRLKPGDRVDCRIKDALVVSPYSTEYDEIRTFEIVSADAWGYYVYVPPYVYLKNTFRISSYDLKKYGISKKFVDYDCLYIQENTIAKISFILEGIACSICEEFYPMAEPNQTDGTLICYCCRVNPYH